MTAEFPENLTRGGRGFRKTGSRWHRFPENWLAVAGVSEKLARDDMFQENWLVTTDVSGKLARDDRCFRKTGSRWQMFKENWLETAVFPEKLAHGGRGCRKKNDSSDSGDLQFATISPFPPT